MDKKTLYHALDRIGKRHMPDTLDILPDLQQQMQRRQQRSSLSRWYQHPQHSMKRIATVLVCLLLAVTTTYAVTQLATNDPALYPDMVTPIGASQTIDGTTVSVEWAYADANRIVLSYSMTTETGKLQREQITDVALTDSQGRFYRPVKAFYADLEIPAMLTGNAHFDAGIIDDNPQSLDLQFRVRDNFVFDVTVPFIAGVQVGKQSAVEAGGFNVNLEQAVITPSMTRIRLCYDVPDNQAWMPTVQLAFEGQRVAQEPGAAYPDFDGIQQLDENSRCRGYIFLAHSDDERRPQTMTLTVTGLQTGHLYSEESMQRAAEVFARYDIEARIVRNTAQETESYLLSLPNPPADPDRMEQIWAEAMQQAGEPLIGERIEGPWIITVELP
jgi:hypothetical protein